MESVCVTVDLKRQAVQEAKILDFNAYRSRQQAAVCAPADYIEDEADEIYWAEEEQVLSMGERLRLIRGALEVSATCAVVVMALGAAARVLLG